MKHEGRAGDPQAATQQATASGLGPQGAAPSGRLQKHELCLRYEPVPGTRTPTPRRRCPLLPAAASCWPGHSEAGGGPWPGLDPNPHVCDESCAPLPLALREPGRGSAARALFSHVHGAAAPAGTTARVSED